MMQVNCIQDAFSTGMMCDDVVYRIPLVPELVLLVWHRAKEMPETISLRRKLKARTAEKGDSLNTLYDYWWLFVMCYGR